MSFIAESNEIRNAQEQNAGLVLELEAKLREQQQDEVQHEQVMRNQLESMRNVIAKLGAALDETLYNALDVETLEKELEKEKKEKNDLVKAMELLQSTHSAHVEKMEIKAEEHECRYKADSDRATKALEAEKMVSEDLERAMTLLRQEQKQEVNRMLAVAEEIKIQHLSELENVKEDYKEMAEEFQEKFVQLRSSNGKLVKRLEGEIANAEKIRLEKVKEDEKICGELREKFFKGIEEVTKILVTEFDAKKAEYKKKYSEKVKSKEQKMDIEHQAALEKTNLASREQQERLERLQEKFLEMRLSHSKLVKTLVEHVKTTENLARTKDLEMVEMQKKHQEAIAEMEEVIKEKDIALAEAKATLKLLDKDLDECEEELTTALVDNTDQVVEEEGKEEEVPEEDEAEKLVSEFDDIDIEGSSGEESVDEIGIESDEEEWELVSE